MPLADYHILDADGNPTGEVIEDEFFKGKPPDFLYSNDGRVAKRAAVMIAKTAGRWGDASYAAGYDPGLGMYINNNVERDRIMKERGLISTSDFDNKHMRQDMYEKKKASNEHWDKREAEYQDLLATGHSEEQASVIWSSKEKCKADEEFYPEELKKVSSTTSFNTIRSADSIPGDTL